MKNVARLATLVAAATLTLTTSQAFADADIAVIDDGTATEATTNVDICVVVPEILIFGVGAVGNDIAKIRWDVVNGVGAGATGNNQTYAGAAAPFVAPLPFSTTAAATVVSGGGTSSTSGNQADLPVFLFSNNGSDVTITATVTAGVGGAGPATDVLTHGGGLANTIAISDFTSGNLGSILHPALTTGATADTAHTGGVVNLADTWTYQYTPTSIPAAGTYSARITYVAAQP